MAQLQGRALRYRCWFLAALAFGGAMLLLTAPREPEPAPALREPAPPARAAGRYTISTAGCTIPGLYPFDDTVRKFIQHPVHLKPCRHLHSSLLANNDSHIWIDNDNLHYYNLSNDCLVSCCYKAFFRPSGIVDIYSKHIDDRVQYQACVEFGDTIKVDDEFVKVSCYDCQLKNIYEQFFLFAKKKALDPEEVKTPNGLNQTAYNVIVLGIDAVSRLNFYRTMPKTLAFLKKKGAVELLGYNKVGDNTFPNLIPMLLGVRDTDLKKMCWANPRKTFDNCPFVWEWFREAGFYTALGEDSASLGTFNFEKRGFAGAPTHYYLRTFMREAESGAGNNMDFNSLICMGNKFFYNVLLDYVQSLTKTLRSSKLFGFFWEVTMSHDYLNYPMLMDDSYSIFLNSLEKSKYLNNTILILLSDHGLRWGDIRYTKQGRLEERLPLVHIVLPPSFRHKFSLAHENLRINSKRLTTPYDIHATLSDLANLESIKDENILVRKKQHYSDDRRISLFLPVPKNRTCEMAGIDDHWCTCHKGRKLATQSEEAVEAARSLVAHLNKLLAQHRQCARLALDAVLEAAEMEAGAPAADEEGWRELLVVARAAPGGGVFEATLRRAAPPAASTRAPAPAPPGAPEPWLLAGTVSRLNLYGHQSRCINHYQLKLYCYCS